MWKMASESDHSTGDSTTIHGFVQVGKKIGIVMTGAEMRVFVKTQLVLEKLEQKLRRYVAVLSIYIF